MYTIPPEPRGNLPYTWVKFQTTKEERARKYAMLRAKGYTPAEARKARDYRDSIIQKHLAILECAEQIGGKL